MGEYLATLPALYGPFLLCFLGWWFNLRVLDWLGGVNFRRDVMPKICDGNLAIAIYFTGRAVAVALLWAAIFGTVR